jgi:hypothetical protein
MVFVCFIHVFIAIIDRIIYARQSRKDVEFEYIYYDKQTGDRLTPLEAKAVTRDTEDQYDILYFQKEGSNYPLMAKYILHVTITILAHFFIFYFLTMVGTYNLQNYIYCESEDISLCNDFLDNSKMIGFYIIYCVYFYFSGLQVYYGLLDMRKKSILMRGDNLIYSAIFKIYKAIPFLYELKLTIDWSCTPTSLDLFKYLKFEMVYDLLFITHCNMKANRRKRVGAVINNISKITMGGGSFLVILIILIGPLLLFSSLNPANISNPVIGAGTELSIVFQINNKVTNTFLLFSNDYVESIYDITDNPDIWKAYKYDKSPKTKNFPKNQVQVVVMSSISDTNWDIARPHIDSIIDRLSNYTTYSYTISLGFRYSFNRNVCIKFNRLEPTRCEEYL